MFLGENVEVKCGILTRSTDRATYRVRNALAQCQFPRPGGRCPVVGMKLISKAVVGVQSTVIYLLKYDNLPFQMSKIYHVFGEK